MIQFLIALTLFTGVNYDSRTTANDVFLFTDPCSVTIEPMQIILRAKPKDRLKTFREIRRQWSSYVYWDEIEKGLKDIGWFDNRTAILPPGDDDDQPPPSPFRDPSAL